MLKKLLLVLAFITTVGACQNIGPDGSPQGYWDRCVAEGRNQAGCAFQTLGYSFVFLFTDDPLQ